MWAKIGQVILSWISRKVFAMLWEDLCNLLADYQAGREKRIREEEVKRISEENAKKVEEAKNEQEKDAAFDDLLNGNSK